MGTLAPDLVRVRSDFSSPPKRQRFCVRQAALSAGSDVAASTVYVAEKDVILRSASITPDGSGANINDSNASTWSIHAGATMILSQTFDDAVPFPASGVPASLGSQPRLIPAGTSLKYSVANGTTAATPATVVTLELEEASPWLDGFNVAASDGGYASILDAAGGGVQLFASDAAPEDNNEAAIYSAEVFKVAAGKPIVAEALLQYAEANTDDANVFLGLMDAVGPNLLRDDGAGPKTSYSGAGIYKVDGGTVWRCHSSIGSSQTATASTTTAGGADYHTLRVEIRPIRGGSTAKVWFFVDGVRLRDADDALIEHTIDFTSTTEIAAVAAVKTGGANAESIKLKWFVAEQSR